METVTSTPESPPVTGKGQVLIIDNNPERANSLIDILKAGRYKVAVPMRLQEGVAEQVALVKPEYHTDWCRFSGARGTQLGRVSPRELSVPDSHVLTR